MQVFSTSCAVCLWEAYRQDDVLQTFHAESRTYWFNHWSSAHALPEGDGEQSLTDYRLLGVVLGLAIYNNVLLDFPLPIALYLSLIHI